MTAEQILQNALNLTRKMTTAQLIEAFEATNGMTDDTIPFVRARLLDVLEERDPAAFDAWLECDDVELIASPRSFYNI